VIVFIGVIAGFFVCLRQARKEGISREIFSDIFFWTLMFSFLGARIVYLAVEFDSFLKNPFAMLFSRSGFVFYGGIIFGFPALYFLTKKYPVSGNTPAVRRGMVAGRDVAPGGSSLKPARRGEFLKMLDILSVGMPLGHAIGRIGCFLEGCCYGRPADSFIGVMFPPDSAAGCSGVKVLPTQLIESFFLFLIFFVILYLSKRKKITGQLFSFYLVTYGILRFIVEFYRGDSRGSISALSTSQFISIFAIITGIFIFYRVKNKNRG
jgi:phosphatidylglycerol:prolipoprotein diacylglycerol transferase